MLEERSIFFGERRRVTLDVWLINGAPFEIEDPEYVITCADMIVAQGEPVVAPRGKHWLLSCYLEPHVANPHIVTMSYWIGEERVVRKLKVNVKR